MHYKSEPTRPTVQSVFTQAVLLQVFHVPSDGGRCTTNHHKHIRLKQPLYYAHRVWVTNLDRDIVDGLLLSNGCPSAGKA